MREAEGSKAEAGELSAGGREAQPEHFASVFHAMWWAVVTLTTVGYGDVYPVTLGGRVFTAFLLMTGVGVIAVPSGLFAASLTKEEDQRRGAEGGADTREVSS